jgi:hypothetical protein
VGSRSLALNQKLLLEPLHRELRKGSQSSNPRCIFIMSPFFLSLIVNPWTSMQSALDIPSASPAIDSQPEGKISKLDKPPSPFAGKPPPKTLNPPGSEGTCIPTGVMSNPTSPPAGDSKHDATNQSPRPDLARHQDASPISPKSFGLRAHGGQQLGEGPSVPRPEKQPRQHSCVAESLWDYPNFVHARFHIDRYLSAVMNTQAKQERIKALYSSM